VEPREIILGLCGVIAAIAGAAWAELRARQRKIEELLQQQLTEQKTAAEQRISDLRDLLKPDEPPRSRRAGGAKQ
jgi:hypothetical protein